MVTVGEIIPMLREVAPQWEPDNDDPLYVQLGSLGRDIVTRVGSGHTEGLDPIFAAMERLHVDGDARTREAATIGILESIQNNAGHQNIPLSTFEPMLRPETRRCWDKLLEFGKAEVRRSPNHSLQWTSTLALKIVMEPCASCPARGSPLSGSVRRRRARPMGVEEDIRLRLSAQRALLTHVTPRLRAVSLEYDTGQHRVWVRFTFDGQPSESVRDAASCAGTEMLADYPEGWDITEEFVVCPAPDPMEHRRLLVYHRCEDSWVEDAEPGAAADGGGV